MKKTVYILSFCLTALSFANLSAQSIKQNIEQHILFLAHDSLSGRYPGAKGENDAAQYIQTQMQKNGCQSFNNNWYQNFAIDSKSSSGDIRQIKGKNVVGYIKGKKNDQYIVIGAHYDHLGMGGHKSGSRMPDTLAVHNGADDNASGVSAMLECARIFSLKKTDCGIIFVAFSAEEQGLVGSKFFVDNLPVPKEKIKAMVNFDMVGRLDSVLTIHGTGTATEFNNIIDKAAAKQAFTIQKNPGGFGPSDHTSFYAEKIPVLYFHTSIHEQYHTPFDDYELINTNGIVTITNFAANVIRSIASKTQTISYELFGEPQSGTSRGGMKVTLGILPDHIGTTQGLRIDAVRPQQAADKGGLKKGDVIMNIQGEKVEGMESYMKLMGQYNKGDIIIIDVLREGKPEIFTIYL